MPVLVDFDKVEEPITGLRREAAEKMAVSAAIAPPAEGETQIVSPEVYADLAFACAHNLITVEQRANLLANPHPEGVYVVLEAVKAKRLEVEAEREAQAKYLAEWARRDQILTVARSLEIITAEQAEALREGRIEDITDNPDLVALEFGRLEDVIKEKMQDLDRVDADTAAATFAAANKDGSLYDGDVTQNIAGGKQSKINGAYHMLPGFALHLFWKTIDNTPCIIEDFRTHLSAARFHLTRVLSDGGLTALSPAMMHLAIALDIGHNADWARRTFRSPGAIGITRVAQVMEPGARKYGRGNWRKIEHWSQIDHAIQHFVAYDAGDESAYKPDYGDLDDKVECNLWNALCRMFFAAEVWDDNYRFTDTHTL